MVTDALVAFKAVCAPLIVDALVEDWVGVVSTNAALASLIVAAEGFVGVENPSSFPETISSAGTSISVETSILGGSKITAPTCATVVLSPVFSGIALIVFLALVPIYGLLKLPASLLILLFRTIGVLSVDSSFFGNTGLLKLPVRYKLLAWAMAAEPVGVAIIAMLLILALLLLLTAGLMPGSPELETLVLPSVKEKPLLCTGGA